MAKLRYQSEIHSINKAIESLHDRILKGRLFARGLTILLPFASLRGA